MGSRTQFSSVKPNDLRHVKDLECFKLFKNKDVQLYKATELVNFIPENIESYCEKLKKKMAKFHRNCLINIELLESLPFTAPAILFEVEHNGKIEYKSVFISITNQDQEYRNKRKMEKQEGGFLCILKKQTSILKHLHECLQNMFLCSIDSCTLQHEQFLWIVGISINELLRRKINDGIKIQFEIPQLENNKFYIRLGLPEDPLDSLWQYCLLEVDNTIKIEGLHKFYYGLTQHIANTYGVYLQSCTVKAISLEGLQITNKLQIHTTTPELLYIFMTFLQSIFYE